MPFTSVTELPDNPTVRIFFTGLMIIAPDEEKPTCEVFVNRSAPDHHLTIEVRRKTPGKPDEIMMRHVGPLSFIGDGDPIHGLVIRKVAPGEKFVKVYEPGTPSTEGEGLSFAINLQGPEFHNGNPDVGQDPVTELPRKLLDVDPLGGRPSLFLDDGVFYTAAKTRPEFEITLKKEGIADKPLPPIASLIGANMYLDDDTSSVTMAWRQQGKVQTLVLKRAPGISYEVYIMNDPLYESDKITDVQTDPKHDEFREYYKILPGVPSSEQFRLAYKRPEEAVDRGSTRTPCMPVLKRR